MPAATLVGPGQAQCSVRCGWNSGLRVERALAMEYLPGARETSRPESLQSTVALVGTLFYTDPPGPLFRGAIRVLGGLSRLGRSQ